MQTGQYRPGLYTGAIALVALLGINAFAIPKSLEKADRQQQAKDAAQLKIAQLEADTQLEKERARLQKEQADAYAENETMPVNSFSIWGYVDNPEVPPQIDFRAFPDPTQQVWIYDGANRCIGFVLQGQFYWRHSKGNRKICQPK